MSAHEGVQPLFNSPMICWSEAGDIEVPEVAIAGHVDNGGTICLEQAGDTIVVNRQTVPALVEMLRRLQTASEKLVESQKAQRVTGGAA